MKWVIERAETLWRTISTELSSTVFYIQAGIVVGWLLGAYIIQRVKLFREEPQPGPLADLRGTIHRAAALV